MRRMLIGAATLLTAVLAGGCTNSEGKPTINTTGTDQCMRREIFLQCLQALPAGPQASKYNDWDEVVGACDSAAYYQSLRKLEVIKPECRV